MDPPLVSVVVPAYNAERFLAATVESVLGQTYPRLEIIIVDDGSTDSTPRIAASFEGRIRYVRQSNEGVSRARNRGVRVSAGDLVAFLDADDLWSPNKLTAQVGSFGSERVVAAFCAAVAFDEAGLERVIPSRLAPDMSLALLLHGPIVGPPSSAVVRRAAFEQVGGFDTLLSQCADWDMWLRLADVGDLAVVAEPLLRYRLHRTNMSRDVRLLEADSLRLLAKYRSREPYRSRYARQWRRIYGNHYAILSGSYLHAGDLRASLRCLLRMVMAHPAAIGRALDLPVRWMRRAYERGLGPSSSRPPRPKPK